MNVRQVLNAKQSSYNSQFIAKTDVGKHLLSFRNSFACVIFYFCEYYLRPKEMFLLFAANIKSFTNMQARRKQFLC